MTKADKVRKYLESYLRTKHEVDRMLELYARLYSTATSANIFYGTKGGDPGNIVENSVIQLDEVKDELIEKKLKLRKKKKTIMKLCKSLKSPRTRQVIIRSYIEGDSRASIADDLNCTLQTVTNIRRRGIEELTNYIKWKE